MGGVLRARRARNPPAPAPQHTVYHSAYVQHVLAAVILLMDKRWSGLRLFRSKRMPKYFLCEGEGEEEVDEEEEEEEQPARKKGPSGPKKRAAMPLQQIFFNRWRAANFTTVSYRRALAVKAQQIADAALAKERKAHTATEEKAKQAEETPNKKAAKADAKKKLEDEKELGPRIKVARDKEAVDRCFECLTRYADPPAGQESLWIECEHCDERCACAEPECKDQLARHEAKCKVKRIRRRTKRPSWPLPEKRKGQPRLPQRSRRVKFIEI